MFQWIKGNKLAWTADAEDSFNYLKNALATTPVLALPDFTTSFFVEPDALNLGIGVVLVQHG